MAYHVVLHDVGAHLKMPPHELVGKRVDDYIAERVVLKGGGHPTGRVVRQLVQRCFDPCGFQVESQKEQADDHPCTEGIKKLRLLESPWI